MKTPEVFEYVKANGPVGPTPIGKHFGYNDNVASSRAIAHLKKLVASGEIIRLKGGKYAMPGTVDPKDAPSEKSVKAGQEAASK